MHHKCIADVIAISSGGKMVAAEVESKHPYNGSIELRVKKY